MRREKALVLSGREPRPGAGSFHPVAIEAVSGGNEAAEASSAAPLISLCEFTLEFKHALRIAMCDLPHIVRADRQSI